MPSTRRGRSCPAKPAIIPACVEPVTVQTIDRVEEDAELLLLLLHLVGPVREAKAAEAVVGCAGRDRVRNAAVGTDRSSAFSQLSLKPIPNPASTSSTCGAHDPRQQDVADPVVHRVRPVDPALLHQRAP